MAVQNLVRQRIGFILNDSSQVFDNYATFMSNSLLQTAKSNSVGTAVLDGYDHFNTGLDDSTKQTYYYLDFLVTPTFQATMQTNMPSVVSAFSPKYTVITFGENMAWGF